MSEDAVWVFCSLEHASEFTLTETTPTTSQEGQSPLADEQEAPTPLAASAEPAITMGAEGASPLEWAAPPATLPNRALVRHLGEGTRVAKPKGKDPGYGEWMDRLVRFSPSALGATGLALTFVSRTPVDISTLVGLATVPLSLFGASRLEARLRRIGEARAVDVSRSFVEPAFRVLPSGEAERVEPSVLRPGEEITVEAGHALSADGIVEQGRALVELFPGDSPAWVERGAELPTGALIHEGRLRMVLTRTGKDRFWAHLVGAAERTEDFAGPSRLARLGQLGTTSALGLFFLVAVALGLTSLEEGLLATAVITAFASQGILGSIARSAVRSHLLRLAARGVSVAPRALEHLGKVSMCVLSARGTVLSGEPELAGIESVSTATPDEVLALAGGALGMIEHPVAGAVLRACHERGIAADVTRSHDTSPGLGVVCTSSRGETLVVGTRELVMRERISVALAEETLRALESRGQTAVLVAREGRLIGLVTLQDALRSGSRAAVQQLLDAGIEPVLLSGDSRLTALAVARALAIDHVRAEIPASDRKRELLSLAEAGATVAAMGTSPRDDGALRGANVAILLGSTRGGDWPRAITVLTGEVGLGCFALVSTRAVDRHVMFATGLGLGLTIVGVVAASSGLFSVLTAPLLGAIGTGLAHWLSQTPAKGCPPEPEYGKPGR